MGDTSTKLSTPPKIIFLAALAVSVVVAMVHDLGGAQDQVKAEAAIDLDEFVALPTEVTEKTPVGNGWYTFEFRGQCFLLRDGHHAVLTAADVCSPVNPGDESSLQALSEVLGNE